MFFRLCGQAVYVRVSFSRAKRAYDYMKYALVLGRNPDLSIAELFNVLGDKIQIAKNRLCVFAESPSPTPSQDFLNRLGGCVEILEIFAENLPQTAVLTEIQKYLVKNAKDTRANLNSQ